MRKFFFPLLTLLLTATHLSAQVQYDNAQVQVQQSIIKFFDGFSALDTIMVKQYSTKDFLLIENGVVWNMDSIAVSFVRIKNQLKGASLIRVNHLDFIQTEVAGNSAWVAYNNTADWTFNNLQKRKKQWLESAFLVKQGNDWKVRMLHSTMLKENNK